jgi:hypothetical protein
MDATSQQGVQGYGNFGCACHRKIQEISVATCSQHVATLSCSQETNSVGSNFNHFVRFDLHRIHCAEDYRDGFKPLARLPWCEPATKMQ